MPELSAADVIQYRRQQLHTALVAKMWGHDLATRGNATKLADEILDTMLTELDRLADAAGPVADWGQAVEIRGFLVAPIEEGANLTPGLARHIVESAGHAPGALDDDRIADYDALDTAIRDYFGTRFGTWAVVHADVKDQVRVLTTFDSGSHAIEGLLRAGIRRALTADGAE